MDTEDPAEHMESAHHASHAQDPFDKRVAATMAIIAVLLAVTAMLSHSANNKTLALRIEASQLTTEASDKWAYFQAKKDRAHTDDVALAMLQANAASREPPSTRPAEAAQIEAWKKEKEKYEKDADDIQKTAYQFEAESKKAADDSHAEEAKADVLDLAELTIQVALVLCSVAILSKRHAFWFSGITIAAVGVCVGAYGLTLRADAKEPTTQAALIAPAYGSKIS
jgi:hypothetical protein